MWRKTSARPWHTHSDVHPRNTWNHDMLECGNETTRNSIRSLPSAVSKSASPKSACAVPGDHSRSRKPSGARPLISSFLSWTYFWTRVYPPS